MTLSPTRNTRAPWRRSGMPSRYGARACCNSMLRLPAPAGPRCIGVSTWMSRVATPNRAGIRRATTSTTISAVASGFLGGEEEEVRVLAEHRRLPGVDAVGVDDHPGLGGLPEDLRQPYPGNGLGGQHVAEHLAGTHRRQLVDVAD